MRGIHDYLVGTWVVTYLVRERTPVTGELVEWLPLLTEPGSLLSGGLQYVVRFAPLLPPAITDTPTTHLSLLQYVLSFVVFFSFVPDSKKKAGQTNPEYPTNMQNKSV